MKHFLILVVFIASIVPLRCQTPPAQAAGYSSVFSEDFSALDLSSNGFGEHNWYPGIYFKPQAPSANTILTGAAGLDLRWNSGQPLYETSIEGCAYDASYCNTYRYGYFEARMKWDVTSGAWPAFWMITKQSVLNVQHVGELDIFEGQGNDPTHYYGTVNEWNGPADLVTTNSTGHNRFPLAAGNDFSQWHTYGVLWVPGKVTWYFDNTSVGSAVTPAIFDQQDFFIVLGSQEGNNWAAGNLTGVTAQTMNLDVAWVHVFQNSGSPVLVPESPEILTTGLPVPNSGLPYAAKVLAGGGKPPYTFSISAGALPSGLQLNVASGVITTIAGGALAVGAYSFTLQVTDSAGGAITQTYSGTVSARVTPNFTSFSLPGASGANGITAGPDGALWFTTLNQSGGNRIGRITTAGVITTVVSANALTQSRGNELPTGGDIAAGLDGRLWIAQRDANTIAEASVDMSSQLTYLPPTANSGPAQITSAPDGTLWFTEASASQIAHVDAGGNFLELSTPTPASDPEGIAVGPYNLIVFTEPAVNKIGYTSGDGTIKGDFAIPTPNSLPKSIVLGPDNAFWFTEFGANKIGRMDFNGVMQEFPISSAPQAISVGPDGALYFTENATNKIGRITILGTITEILIPDVNSGPIGIVTGPDDNLWFTENNLSRVGRLSFVPGGSVNCPLPAGPLAAGSAMSAVCIASQGTPPYSFAATGLPPGVSMNASTGLLSGTLTTAGIFTVEISVTDGVAAHPPVHQVYTITVIPLFTTSPIVTTVSDPSPPSAPSTGVPPATPPTDALTPFRPISKMRRAIGIQR